ncbi:MAG: hypothetical protein R3E12_02155 [Candidatus Eisenbacteria bacterium]
MILLTTMATDRPERLLLDSMTRARFAELLARDLEMSSRRRALPAGTFSMLDAIIGKEMADVLQGLPVPADIRDVALGQRRARPVLQFVIAYERADAGEGTHADRRAGPQRGHFDRDPPAGGGMGARGLADTDHGSASSKAA